MMIKVGIVGGTGYTGIELLRILARHPQSELVAITSRKNQARAPGGESWVLSDRGSTRLVAPRGSRGSRPRSLDRGREVRGERCRQESRRGPALLRSFG